MDLQKNSIEKEQSLNHSESSENNTNITEQQKSSEQDIATILNSENLKCKNVYEVMAHIGICAPLAKLVFGDKNLTKMSKEARVNFFSQTENIEKLLNYIMIDEERLYLLGDAISNFYAEHKEAFEKVGINHTHRNVAGLFIGFLKNFSSTPKNTNKTSIIMHNDLAERFNSSFMSYIYEKNKKAYGKGKIIVDNHGNDIDEEDYDVVEYFNSPIIKIKGKYVYLDTRKAVEIDLNGKKFNIMCIGKEVERNGKQYLETIIFSNETSEKITLLLDKNFRPIKIDENRVFCYEDNHNSILYNIARNKEVKILLDENFHPILTNKWNEIENITFNFIMDGSFFYETQEKLGGIRLYIVEKNGKYIELDEKTTGAKIININSNLKVEANLKGKYTIGTLDRNLRFVPENLFKKFS